MVTGSKTILHSIRRSIERAGLKLEGFVLGNLALGMSAASVDEIDLGIGLVDIGHEKTTVSVFYRGDLVYSYILPVGGDHMTRDLVYKLNCKYQDAKVAKKNTDLPLKRWRTPQKDSRSRTSTGKSRSNRNQKLVTF